MKKKETNKNCNSQQGCARENLHEIRFKVHPVYIQNTNQTWLNRNSRSTWYVSSQL